MIVIAVQVTRAPSETERILTNLRGQVNIVLGRDRLPEARKHLQTLEVLHFQDLLSQEFLLFGAF